MKSFNVNLKPGERIFVNGAVIRVDRRVSLEFLNEVTFLLEQHVIAVEETTTPLRQLYFILQTMLMGPSGTQNARALFDKSYQDLKGAVDTVSLSLGLDAVNDAVESGRTFEALKLLRALFTLETAILKGAEHSASPSHEARI